MCADGLLYRSDGVYRGTETGKLLIRNVAALFDAYLPDLQKKVAFSKAI